MMSMCIVFSLVIGKGCLLWPGFSLKKTLLAFPLLHFVLQGQTCLSFRVFLDFLLLHSNPLWWKGHFFFFNGSSRRCCRYSKTCQLQLLQHQWLGIDLDYCAVEWFTLKMNWDHSVILEAAPEYCILNSVLDPRDQIANIHWIMEKAREFQKKHIFLLYWLCQSLWLCGSQ